jgi:hypothetical protein
VRASLLNGLGTKNHHLCYTPTVVCCVCHPQAVYKYIYIYIYTYKSIHKLYVAKPNNGMVPKPHNICIVEHILYYNNLCIYICLRSYRTIFRCVLAV